MKILIITSFFPPQNSIASQRPYSWAKYWSRAGHEVTVLTTVKREMPSDSPMSTEGFKVIEVPIPGFSFLLKAVGSNNDSAASTGVNKNGFMAPVKKIIDKIKKKYGIFSACRMPDLMDLWACRAYFFVKDQNWDLVVSTAWPYSVHGPAYRLKKSGKATRWIADWRDLWTDNHMFPGLPVFRSIEHLLERRWCKAADIITTVSEPLADILKSKYGDKVHTIHNGFDPEDYDSLPLASVFPRDNVFRILYTGTIYKGQRDPTPLFEAIRKMDEAGEITAENLRIIFCGHNADVGDIAKKELVESYVEYGGFVPRQQALAMQRDADALLFLEFESKEVKGILTGKLFEYLFAGPPVIAIGVNNDSGAGEVLRRCEKGFAFGTDSYAIGAYLTEIMNNRSLRTNKIEAMEKYNREVLAGKLLNLI